MNSSNTIFFQGHTMKQSSLLTFVFLSILSIMAISCQAEVGKVVGTAVGEAVVAALKAAFGDVANKAQVCLQHIGPTECNSADRCSQRYDDVRAWADDPAGHNKEMGDILIASDMNCKCVRVLVYDRGKVKWNNFLTTLGIPLCGNRSSLWTCGRHDKECPTKSS
jgi:hypothetical protein